MDQSDFTCDASDRSCRLIGCLHVKSVFPVTQGETGSGAVTQDCQLFVIILLFITTQIILKMKTVGHRMCLFLSYCCFDLFFIFYFE